MSSSDGPRPPFIPIIIATGAAVEAAAWLAAAAPVAAAGAQVARAAIMERGKTERERLRLAGELKKFKLGRRRRKGKQD